MATNTTIYPTKAPEPHEIESLKDSAGHPRCWVSRDDMAYYDSPSVVRTRCVTPSTCEMSMILPYVTDKNIARHLGIHGKGELGHARCYYNPAMRTLYSRYDNADWHFANRRNFKVADDERSHAERLRSDAWRAVKETDARTRNRQNDVTKRLGERVADLAFWKNELNKEIGSMDDERNNLKEYQLACEKALADTALPLHIAEECLLAREKRQGIDLVNDDVEKGLVKEVQAIKNCQARMKKVLDKTYIQVKLNRAAQHALELDAKDKFHAQTLDDRISQLRNSSAGIGYIPGIENVDNTITVPESWARYTQENINRAQKERANSERLRCEIDRVLRECANEMWRNFNAVNNAFNAKIRETTDIRNKLQANLQRVLQEIFDMERNIDLLRKAIIDKELPMKVAQTRLDERTRRINVELCHDTAMMSMQREVAEIRDSVRLLKERLKASELSMARLMKMKGALEHDISIKDNSLKIDAVICMGLRKGFPMDPKTGPIFQMPVC